MKEYYYSIFGLNFKCSFKIIQLIERNQYIADKDLDAIVRISIMPKHIINEIEINNKNCDYREDEYWFFFKNVGIYRIYNKKFIDIMPNENADDEEIRSYLLSGAFFLLMAQKKIVALHGGIIELNNGAVLITGECGAGKSTLVNEFVFNGYKYMSDDVGVVKIINNTINIVPGYPQLKLCRDAAKKFGYDLNRLIYIDEERDKFAIRSRENFLNEVRQLKAIYEIGKDSQINEVTIQELKGSNKIKCIINNLYERDICKYIGIDREYFSNLLKIAKEVPYYRINRPSDKFTVNQQMELIKNNVL